MTPTLADGVDEVIGSAASSGEAAVDLYWLPLGAGGRSMRTNGSPTRRSAR